MFQLLCPDQLQEDEDISSDYGSRDKPGTALGRTVPDGNALLPDIFHTDRLLFYERFKAYQDYILGKKFLSGKGTCSQVSEIIQFKWSQFCIIL